MLKTIFSKRFNTNLFYFVLITGIVGNLGFNFYETVVNPSIKNDPQAYFEALSSWAAVVNILNQILICAIILLGLSAIIIRFGNIYRTQFVEKMATPNSEDQSSVLKKLT